MCAFLNSEGGELLLGVKDDGRITGVAESEVQKIKNHFINVMNSGSKINPPIHLDIKDVKIDDKTILYINVIQSSQVHRCNAKTFIRQNDSDVDITNNNPAILKLHVQKDSSYSENKIFPFARFEQFRPDLFERARRLVNNENPNHPWNELDNMGILKRETLYMENLSTGEKGFTLAAILLFGSDEMIASVVPAFKIDLIKRVKNTSRYDDRLVFSTNLIESYDKILEFVSKHLPDPFFLEGEQRINLRQVIFREIIANMLIHKEYLNAEPTQLIIEKNQIRAINSNKPFINGIINLDNLVAHPKNPNIARIFRQFGRAEEMGSGINNLYKYCKEYSGYEPEVRDGALFYITIKHNFFTEESVRDIDKHPSDIDSDIDKHPSDIDSDIDKHPSDIREKLLAYCITEHSLTEIMSNFGYKQRAYFLGKILNPLISQGYLRRTIPEKPTSRNQKYVTVKK